jgi:hypothetical protein
VTGAAGAALLFKCQFVDNVFVKRRGDSSLAWPKPKLKFELPSKIQVGKVKAELQDVCNGSSLSLPVFCLSVMQAIPGGLLVDSFGLESLFYELGERSMMKPFLGLSAMREAGVYAPEYYYVNVW